MGNDIGLGLSFKAICFDFCSSNVGISVIGTGSTVEYRFKKARFKSLLSQYMFCACTTFIRVCNRRGLNMCDIEKAVFRDNNYGL